MSGKTDQAFSRSVKRRISLVEMTQEGIDKLHKVQKASCEVYAEVPQEWPDKVDITA
ncbi:hypothetical protein [Bacillus glycinifermentans]|uniref:hypothetical protein n=1 Tax=Bacillus glycinifermentans TaxID=1664069 RepID=UPI00398AB22D